MSIYKIKCPNNLEHKRFSTTGTQWHTWILNNEMDLLENHGCFDAENSSDIDDYTCTECGATAEIDDD